MICYIKFVHRGIAQLVEQRSPKPRAEGSSPSAPAILVQQNRCTPRKVRIYGLFSCSEGEKSRCKTVDAFLMKKDLNPTQENIVK